jgi:peptidyl-prolyl cis-trans isomerase D
MLETLRKGAGTWVAKIFIGLLVLSFAVWGIADIFSGFSDRTLATVGDTEISPQTFRYELQRQTSNLSRQLGRQISAEESRRFNLPQRVLGQLITDAALDNQARKLGLGVSDEALANSIKTDPAFQDQFGNFNRLQFERILQSNGLNEASYAYQHRGVLVRQQIAKSIMGNIAPPKTMLKALNQYQNETRTAKYFILPAKAAGEIAPPTKAEEKAYHAKNAALFTAPQYRSLSILELDPALVAKAIKVNDEDIAASYEARKPEFQKDETRDIDQMMFKDEAKAAKAHDMLSKGAKFEDVVKTFGFNEKDVHLGVLGRSLILDKKVADAAFALKEGEVSKPVKGTFGTAIIRVRKINPAAVKSLDEVKDQIREKLALELAADKVLDIHDQIEDERAAGSTLKEIADKFKLKYIEIKAVDANGRNKAGKPEEKLPSSPQLLKLAFESDVGVENDPVPSDDNGYWWVDVTGVIPEKLRPIAEVREDIKRSWILEKRSEKLLAKAQELIKRLEGGESMEAVAKSEGLEVAKSKPLKRASNDKVFSRSLIRALFSHPRGGYFEGRPVSGEDRVIAQVDSIILPDAAKSTKEMQEISKLTGQVIRNDLLSEYVGALRDHYGVKINSRTFQALTGSDNPG